MVDEERELQKITVLEKRRNGEKLQKKKKERRKKKKKKKSREYRQGLRMRRKTARRYTPSRFDASEFS